MKINVVTETQMPTQLPQMETSQLKLQGGMPMWCVSPGEGLRHKACLSREECWKDYDKEGSQTQKPQSVRLHPEEMSGTG